MKKKAILVLCILLLVCGCKKESKTEIKDNFYNYNLNDPVEKGFYEYSMDYSGINPAYESDYIEPRNLTNNELGLSYITTRYFQKEVGREYASNLNTYNIGPHKNKYKLKLDVYYKGKSLKENIFIIPPCDHVQYLYYTNKFFITHVALIDDDTIQSYYETDLNEFVGYDIYCERGEYRSFIPTNKYPIKKNMIIDKRSLFINTKEEVNSGNTNYDKKLFITISLEVVE